MEYLRSVIVQDEVLTASTTTDLIDLPVNPISHLLITIRALNDTGTITNYSYLDTLLALITKVEVLYRGQAIFEGSLTDLAVLNAILTGWNAGQIDPVRTDNARRTITVPLNFGRVPYWPEECFPATSRGEFQMRLTVGAAQTGIDTYTWQLETVELLNSTPARFLKATAYTGTASAAGELDRDLPRGNPILGVLLFGTTIDAAAGGVNTIDTVKVLVDNKEMYYQKANWETLHGELARRIAGYYTLLPHFHSVDVADASGTVRSTNQQEHGLTVLEKYAYLDFDPMKNGEYFLMTDGRGRVALRINFGDTNAMRFIPIELMSVAGAGQGA